MIKDNKGYSLLEMIIVFGMAAILVGSAVSFTGYIRFANSKSCSEKLYSAIDKLQVTSMSKQQKKLMVVWRNDGTFYYDVYSYDASSGMTDDEIKDACKSACVSTGASATKLGNSALTIKYKKSDGTYHELSDGGSGDNLIFIAYSSNGSFNMSLTGTDEIIIASANGDGVRYTIKLIPQTGKHFLKQ